MTGSLFLSFHPRESASIFIISAHPPAGDGLVVSRRHPRHRTATTLAHECQVGSNDCKGCRGGAKSEQG